MLLVAAVRQRRRKPVSSEEANLFGIDKLKVARSEIPAVSHVDYSARVQTVDKDTNPRFHELLDQFKARTGCPVLINTSFNVRGEPIVNTPDEAFRCFMGTELDVLAIGKLPPGEGRPESSIANQLRRRAYAGLIALGSRRPLGRARPRREMSR